MASVLGGLLTVAGGAGAGAAGAVEEQAKNNLLEDALMRREENVARIRDRYAIKSEERKGLAAVESDKRQHEYRLKEGEAQAGLLETASVASDKRKSGYRIEELKQGSTLRISELKEGAKLRMKSLEKGAELNDAAKSEKQKTYEWIKDTFGDDLAKQLIAPKQKKYVDLKVVTDTTENGDIAETLWGITAKGEAVNLSEKMGAKGKPTTAGNTLDELEAIAAQKGGNKPGKQPPASEKGLATPTKKPVMSFEEYAKLNPDKAHQPGYKAFLKALRDMPEETKRKMKKRKKAMLRKSFSGRPPI